MISKTKVDLGKVKHPISSISNTSMKISASTAVAFYKADPERKNGVSLTTAQLGRMFDVTQMTIYNWRQNRGMPYYHLKGGRKPPVRYDEGLILHWAEAHGILIEYDDYLEY